MCVGEEKDREKWAVGCFSSWPAAKEKGGVSFAVVNEEREYALPNENFLFIFLLFILSFS